MKSKILISKSETNQNLTNLNVQNGSLPKACRDSGLLALRPRHAVASRNQTPDIRLKTTGFFLRGSADTKTCGSPLYLSPAGEPLKMINDK